MLNRLCRYLDCWRSGVLAVGIHHCLLILLERHHELKQNTLDFLDAIPYHFLNSVAYIWEPKTNLSFDPLRLEAYQWHLRGWPSWVFFLVLTSIQWFIFGAAVSKAISLWRERANRTRYRHAPILKLFAVVLGAYVLWYGWITAYSYRWYLRRLPMNHYELCGIVGVKFPSQTEVKTWKTKDNYSRSAFFRAYQRGSPARLGTIGYPEQNGPYHSWLFIDQAEKPVRKMSYVMDLLGYVRFRDFLYRGWTAESTDEFDEIRLLTYKEVKELYNQSRNLRAGEIGDRCLMNSVSFFNDGTDLLYLAVYRNNGDWGRVIEIY